MVDETVDGAEDVDVEARRAVEAMLMVAVDPVPPNLLAQLLELPTKRIEAICEGLADAYEAEGRGFALVRVGGGYRYQSHPDQAPWVERFVVDGQSSRLTSAALETLAIVAYKQPISRAQVSAIRGVDVDGVMRTLQQRGFIDEVIMPHSTRRRVARGLRMLRNKDLENPWKKHDNIPL